MAATEVTAKIDAALSAKLEALARRTRRTKEALAAAAIAAYVELDDWQIGEIKTGLAELDRDERCPKQRPRRGIDSCYKRVDAAPSRIRAATFGVWKTFASASRPPTQPRRGG